MGLSKSKRRRLLVIVDIWRENSNSYIMPQQTRMPNFIKLSDIPDELNNHQNSIKRVFVRNEDTVSAITQVAYGFMQKAESSGLHQHATMDEYFYFIKGTGVYTVGAEEYIIEPKTFVRVSATTPHNLVQTGHETLEFVYWGVAV